MFSRTFSVGAALVMGLILSGCGGSGLGLDASLTVVMYGAFEAPADAAGNAEPDSANFTLNDVSLVSADGSTKDLYDKDPYSARIINRSQILTKLDLARYEGETFTAIVVTFEPAIVVVGKLEDKLPIVLADPAPRLIETFTVEAAKSKRLEIKVQWKNIITRDQVATPPTETITAPSFSLELKNG